MKLNSFLLQYIIWFFKYEVCSSQAHIVFRSISPCLLLRSKEDPYPTHQLILLAFMLKAILYFMSFASFELQYPFEEVLFLYSTNCLLRNRPFFCSTFFILHWFLDLFQEYQNRWQILLGWNHNLKFEVLGSSLLLSENCFITLRSIYHQLLLQFFPP